MEVEILKLLEGAKRAKGLTVIIDVFRAFSVECYLMKKGVARIIPVGDKEIAYQMKEENPEVILVGERRGVKLPGFDFGNSPSQIEPADLRGKTVVHTTSAGTQGIANAVHADEIIVASFVNAKAVAAYITQTNPDYVSLVAMGLDGREETLEDNLCAEYIKWLLEEGIEKDKDISEDIEKLKVTTGAKFFKKELQEVFPQRDFELCVQKNQFSFVLRVGKDEKGRNSMEKIEVNVR